MKPDWSNAPSWAQYLAMDEDGAWFWYENEPKQLLSCWDQNDGNFKRCGMVEKNSWTDSLEARP